MPRSTRKATVGASHPPPSSLTIFAPACIRHGTGERLLGPLLVTAEWHVRDQPARLKAARHAARVIRDLGDRDRQRVEALDHHAERVADEHAVDAVASSSRAKLAS